MNHCRLHPLLLLLYIYPWRSIKYDSVICSSPNHDDLTDIILQTGVLANIRIILIEGGLLSYNHGYPLRARYYTDTIMEILAEALTDVVSHVDVQNAQNRQISA